MQSHHWDRHGRSWCKQIRISQTFEKWFKWYNFENWSNKFEGVTGSDWGWDKKLGIDVDGKFEVIDSFGIIRF